MALNLDTAIRLTAEVKGGGNIDRVKKSLQDLALSSQVSGRQIDKLYTETQRFSSAAGNSVNALTKKKAALEALRNSIDPASRRFAVLSQDIAKVTTELKKADEAGSAFGLASALSLASTSAAAGTVSFAGYTASTQAVTSALQRMGVDSKTAGQMLKSLQGDMNATAQSGQKLGAVINQALGSTPEKATAQINAMRQALGQLKIGSEEYLKALVRVNEAEGVMQVRTGRAGVIAANTAFAGPTMTSGYGSNERLTAMPNTIAADMQRISELTRRVQNLDRTTDEYRRSLQELEVVQRRLNTQPEERGGGLRSAFGSAGAVALMGGGPMSSLSALAGGLAFSGGPAGIAAGAGISAALGVGALASRVGVDAETARVRLKALTDQFGEYNQAQAAAARIASTLRISTVEAQDGFGKLYAALRPTGVTLQEVEDAFIGFTAAARASGATAQESSAALLQLKQALGSGVLQGDELRSIREQAPAVGQAIAKEMGVTIGELKKLGSEGKITTDIVLRALARLRNEKLGQLSAQFNTSAQAMKDLQIATEDFGRVIAQVFGPTAIALLRTFTSAIRGVAGAIEFMTAAPGANAPGGGRQALNQSAVEARAGGYGTTYRGGQRGSGSTVGGMDLRGVTGNGVTPSQRQAQQAAAAERLAAQRRAAIAANSSGSSKGGSKPSVDEQIAARPFGRQIIAAARANGLEPALLAALVSQESGGNARAISRSGAIGLTQLMPGTARELGVNPYDPLQNLMGGARYLRQQISRFGLEGGLRAYNQGPGAQMRTPGGNSRESREYPGRVLARYRQLTGGQGDLTGMDTEALQAQIEEQKRVEDILRSRTAEIDLLGVKFNLEDQIAQAQGRGDALLARRLQGEQRQVEIQYEYARLLADPTNQDVRVQELLTQQGLLELQAEQLRTERELQDLQRQRSQDQMQALQQYIEKQYELNTAVQQQKSMAESISGTIGQGMSSAFSALISGAESWGDSLRRIASEALVDIANQLIRIYVIEQAVGFIKDLLTPFNPSTPIGAGGGKVGKFGTFGPNYGIPQRANGGPVIGDLPYIVGERGPELFIPSQSGVIVPNHKVGMGGNTVVSVSVDASGSQVQGDEPNAAQLGRVIAGAVQAELVKQKRPGGILAS